MMDREAKRAHAYKMALYQAKSIVFAFEHGHCPYDIDVQRRLLNAYWAEYEELRKDASAENAAE